LASAAAGDAMADWIAVAVQLWRDKPAMKRSASLIALSRERLMRVSEELWQRYGGPMVLHGG